MHAQLQANGTVRPGLYSSLTPTEARHQAKDLHILPPTDSPLDPPLPPPPSGFGPGYGLAFGGGPVESAPSLDGFHAVDRLCSLLQENEDDSAEAALEAIEGKLHHLAMTRHKGLPTPGPRLVHSAYHHGVESTGDRTTLGHYIAGLDVGREEEERDRVMPPLPHTGGGYHNVDPGWRDDQVTFYEEEEPHMPHHRELDIGRYNFSPRTAILQHHRQHGPPRRTHGNFRVSEPESVASGNLGSNGDGSNHGMTADAVMLDANELLRALPDDLRSRIEGQPYL